MSENQETPQETLQEIPQETPDGLSLGVANLKTNVGEILNSWKLKVGLIAAALLGLFFLWFFWQQTIAGIGMKGWAARSDARPIECMRKDTNDDGYVSCSAILNNEVVPLECGASIWNIGCRVNYNSAPPVANRQFNPR